MIFEGRDAAGQGGTIKRITEYLSPRVSRSAAAGAHRARDGEWYYQRYVAHLPTGRDHCCSTGPGTTSRCRDGDGILAHSILFLRQTPMFERMFIDDGILLRKYWFSVSEENGALIPASGSPIPVPAVEALRRWTWKSVFPLGGLLAGQDQMMVHTDLQGESLVRRGIR